MLTLWPGGAWRRNAGRNRMNGVYGAMNLRWVLKSPSLGSINRLRNPRRNSRETKREAGFGGQ